MHCFPPSFYFVIGAIFDKYGIRDVHFNKYQATKNDAVFTRVPLLWHIVIFICNLRGLVSTNAKNKTAKSFGIPKEHSIINQLSLRR